MLPVRIELTSLPRGCPTTELRQRRVRIEAAENRTSVPDTRRAERRQLVERLRALQAEARDCPDGATKAAMAKAREALGCWKAEDENRGA